jgi:hypothetical protein
MLDTGYLMLDAGYWMPDAGCWILDAGYYKSILHFTFLPGAVSIIFMTLHFSESLNSVIKPENACVDIMIKKNSAMLR